MERIIISHDAAGNPITTTEVLTDQQAAEIQQLLDDTAWDNLRRHRNHLLGESDWTVLADTPTPTAAWKVYRQALRDLPANTTDPTAVVWPTPPS